MNENLQYWKLMTTCIMLSFLIGCASTGSPSGGPRDKTPPRLVEEKSSKNFSTNFSPDKLELVFDEWIELKNQQREILISPPFFKTPKIKSRGKKVTVEFPKEESLRADATYTINFGKSIVDFTEGNAAEGFKFVFATGDKIDSLGLSGSIREARNDKPVKDILILLYDILSDSVVVSEKPFYYARTDDSGNFKFENLKNDTFKLLVLEDLNFNYLLDPELERLAFPDSLLILNDSSTYNPKLRLFKPEQSVRIINSSSKTPGLITTEFNQSTEAIDYRFLYPSDFEPLVEKSKDTILFWFAEQRDSVGILYGLDTLDFTIKPFDSIFYNRILSITGYNAAKTILAPFDSLIVSFISPLAEIDTSLIRLTKQPVTLNNITKKGGMRGSVKDSIPLDKGVIISDSIRLDSVEINIDSNLLFRDTVLIDSINVDQEVDSAGISAVIDIAEVKVGIGNDTLSIQLDSLRQDSLSIKADTVLMEYDFTFSTHLRQLFINSKWIEKYDYRIEMLPGAITDIYGRQNDTLVLDFKTAGLEEFGNITINLSGLDSAQRYVVLLKQKDEILKRTIVLDSTIQKIEYKKLRVNTYSIELIKDDDGNGAWTTGDYWKRRQPEALKTFELEKLRENWDLEAEVYWNEPETLLKDSTGIIQDSTLLNTPGNSLKKKKPDPRSGNPRDKSNNRPDPKGKND